jgi:peptidoglycan L-alanyl-D-glutamate endopeptidase CwlK
MRDKISIERANMLHPAIRQEVIHTIIGIETSLPNNMMVRLTRTLSTFAEQAAIFAQGRTTKGAIVTKARAGQSIHNYGLAFDFVLLYDLDENGSFEKVSWDTLLDYDKDASADWQEVVRPFKNLGYSWGGDFKSISDSPHIEKTFGLTWRQMLARHNSKNFIPNTKYIKL